MKLIYCIHSIYNPGGMERVTLNKLRWFSAHTDWDLTVVTTDQHGRPPFFELPERVRTVDLGVNYSDDNGKNPLVRVFCYFSRRRRHRKALAALLMREKADVVVSLFPCESSFIPSMTDGSRKVLELHQGRYFRIQYARKGLLGLFDRLRTLIDPLLVRRFDKFIVLTEEDAADWGNLPYLFDNTSAEPSSFELCRGEKSGAIANLAVLPNAVPSALVRRSEEFRLQISTDFTDRPHRVIAAGRFDYQKGFDRLIDAWRILQDEDSVGDWHLDIFGQGEWGGMLQNRIDGYGLTQSVSLRPPVRDIAAEYMNSSVFALSSHYEGLPMVMIEAMACGLPAVSFDCKCGPKDIISDGRNGLLVRDGDVRGLAAALKQVMWNERLRKKMSAEAVLVSERYSEDRIMGEWQRLFTTLAGTNRVLVQINPVARLNTSTGRIMREIGDLAAASGWKSYIAYSRGRDGEADCGKSVPIPVGSSLSVIWHGLMTRIFDRHGLSSDIATFRFIRKLRRISPAVVQIHNIHGYFLNYRLLFDYFRRSGIPVVWTVHDCWLYTGHCYHYASAGCDRWQYGCGNCPQKRQFPSSLLFDRSARNFEDKSRTFNSLAPGQLTLVTVSEWMRQEMSHSFLRNCRFQMIHNGIDTSVFSPADKLQADAVREAYSLGNRRVCLAVASVWSREKGWDDLVSFSALLSSDEVLVIVGVNEEQAASLPPDVVGIAKTADAAQLACLYSIATVLLNFTYQDNYPTVNLEAISCGTPVITYRTGGSVEAVAACPPVSTGFVVEQGDYHTALEHFRRIAADGKERYAAPLRNYALAHFRKEDSYSEYLRLYDAVVSQSFSINR